ncbi:AAA ATPase [Nostoc sp. NIES-3756]|uniref:hypothetical protein n=1 Tax=Nostoc sp. NIES-3756 TaxID=1751286 RepID=UPI0007224590|nr:hypothetical protein [Nostoc sp. NIES-3756]BAT51200.1 AAA ATPase [Nostoc sp. NIES-3756]
MSGAISQSAGDNAILFGSIGQVGTINILKLDPATGAKVTLVPPENQQYPQLRSLPIILNPRPFPLLLGRREEVKIALDALPYDQPVEFFGLAGVGKTVLLRYLAHHPSITPAFPDGIIYHRCNQYESVSDLLQVLFNAFYESSIPFKPSDIEIRQVLRNKKALIILDGAKLTRADVQGLIIDLPSFTFLFTAGERQLWGEGQPVKLGGLPLNDALALVARELGHPLSQAERADAESLCIALDGHPLKILQAVALVKEEDLSLAAIAKRFQTATNSSWVEKLLSSLKKPQRLILALLAALGANIALAPQRIADLTELPQVQTLLESLLKRNLIEVEGDHLRWDAAHRYSLASSLVEELQQQSDVTHWMERSVNYFTNWLQQNSITESLMQESQTILRVVEWSAGVGRWADVITLGKALEGSLALSGQWGTWDKLLHWLLEAARVTGNQAIEAYTLHQLGTRALCLNEVVPAQDYLSQALRIRESLNDQAGIEVTRHNLQFLTNPPLPPKPKPDPQPDFSQLIKFGFSVVLLIMGGLFWRLLLKPEVQPLVPPPTSSDPTTSSLPITSPSPPPEVVRIKLQIPTEVIPGETINGTITLTSSAAEDIPLIVSSEDSSLISVPSQQPIIISRNTQQTQFRLQVASIENFQAEKQVKIKIADASGKIQTVEQTLTVKYSPPPSIEIVRLNLQLPTEVLPGQSVDGTITLTSSAAEDIPIIVSSEDNSLISVPSQQPIIFSRNTTRKQFRLRVAASENFQADKPLKITFTDASGRLQTIEKTLTVKYSPPPAQQEIIRFNLQLPTEVSPGKTINGTITLTNSAAEDIPIIVNSEDNSLISVPSQQPIIVSRDTRRKQFRLRIAASENFQADQRIKITVADKRGILQTVEETLTVKYSPPPPPVQVRLEFLQLQPPYEITPSNQTIDIDAKIIVNTPVTQDTTITIASEDSAFVSVLRPQRISISKDAQGKEEYPLNLRIAAIKNLKEDKRIRIIASVEDKVVGEITLTLKATSP